MENPLDQLETQMAVLARRIEGASRRSTIHRRMDRSAYLIARTLDAVGPASVNEIAKALSLDASTVTRQVAAMNDRGFVMRTTRADDRRVWQISLTPPGRNEMLAVSEARRKRFAEILGGWSHHDLAQLSRLLERFNASLADAPEHPLANDPALPHATGGRRRDTALGDHRRSVVPANRRRR